MTLLQKIIVHTVLIAGLSAIIWHYGQLADFFGPLWRSPARRLAAAGEVPQIEPSDYQGKDRRLPPLGVLGNVLWLVLAGWWLALAHIVTAILLAITIVGMPFAWAHLKLAGLALWPIGKMIVPA